MNILTGFAVINDRNGKRVTYTYDKVDELGNIQDSNKKASYIVLDEESKGLIESLELLIEGRIEL